MGEYVDDAVLNAFDALKNRESDTSGSDKPKIRKQKSVTRKNRRQKPSADEELSKVAV